MTDSPTLALAQDLIRRRSVTPQDDGCQQLMAERLEAAGFTVEHLRYGDVDNFWAVHGDAGPILCLAGHTDVVPPGDESAWQHPPFEPVLDGDQLCGRGAADMKGSLAAMVTAAERFCRQHPDHSGRLAFLITSDEEGIAVNGTVKVVEWLAAQNLAPNWCVVGEPSSSEVCGDVVKNGRRGSLGATLIVRGTQGHVAYPHLAENPIHGFAPALAELSQTVWDEGNDYFPATSFQVSNINGGTGATNVIPGELEVVFNFRFSTETTAQQLKDRTQAILDRHGLSYDLSWHLSGEPFLTEEGDLLAAVRESIHEAANIEAQLSTAGGTSDGRFIAPLGTQVVELGPVNATIHKVDERVSAQDLDNLSAMYEGIMARLLP